MKTIINILFITFIILSINNISIAQIEDHYHSFNGNIYIPIIVDHQEKWDDGKGNITEKPIPEKQINIYFHMKAEDMRVNDNVFSGIIITNGAVVDEVITYKGKVSEDKQMMEYMEITKNHTQYLTGKREVIEKKVTLSARFENIPTWMMSYRFKYGVTKIASVDYNEEYYLPRQGRLTTYTETFVKIDEGKITKHTTNCIQAGFKPGNEKISNKINKKIAVIVEQDKREWGGIMRGIGALIISDFMKIPGLKVLERMHIEELKGEIDLSQTGLVNPETEVRGDRMMTPDIEVIVTQENRIPADMDLMFESFAVRSKIRIVETGQIIDPNLIFILNMKKTKLFWEDWSDYIKRVVNVTKNFLYE